MANVILTENRVLAINALLFAGVLASCFISREAVLMSVFSLVVWGVISGQVFE